jgi:hypothetical protein
MSANNPSAAKVSLRRIVLNAQGYDSGGGYWGVGPPLWWAVSGDAAGSVDLHFRAHDREAAKAHIRTLHPGARFHR